MFLRIRPQYSLFILLFFIGCSTARKAADAITDADLKNFASLMTGKFSSAAQSKQDSNYFDISLVMSRIWRNREDGIWLYVEQAQASLLNKPYRQRVYRLTHPSADIYVSEVYTIKNAAEFVGLFRDTLKERNLSYDKIEKKEGCDVRLRYSNGIYEGGTEADKCPSDLRGAKYATTRITLKPGELHSWDQGFDASGKQVWGATKGGYIFIKE